MPVEPAHTAPLTGDPATVPAAWLAAIDVGTNSVHLVVARVLGPDRFEIVTRQKEQVRLGSGGGELDRLAEDAIDRAIAALRRCARIAQQYGAPVAAYATSAVREASNAAYFIRRARVEAGIDVQVISGVEEARLINLGVLQALPVYDERRLVIDIGGGSTELIVGEQLAELFVRSLKLGSIRTSRRFGLDGPHGPEAVEICRRHVRSTLSPLSRRLRRLGPTVAVGSSGTIEMLVRMALRRAGTDDPTTTLNGVSVSTEDLRSLVEDLANTPFELRADVAGIDRERADIVLGGAIVLDEVLRAVRAERLVVSEFALREGMLIDLMEREGGGALDRLGKVRRRSVEHLLDSLDDDSAHARTVSRLARRLFDQFAGLHRLQRPERELLRHASLLANVGLAVSHSQHHKHSYYVIRNTDRLRGFTNREIELMAQIARYHRRGLPSERHPEFAALEPADQRVVQWCAGLLRVAVALDRVHAHSVADVVVEVGTDLITIRVIPEPDHDVELEIWTAGQRTELLEALTGRAVEVERA